MSITTACGDQSLITSVNFTPTGAYSSAYDGVMLDDSVIRRLETLEARLAIIEPNQVLQDKYPALQEAYETYKIIERMVNDKKT